MSKKTRKPDYGAVTPIRIPASLESEIGRIAAGAKLSKADIMRLALERGLTAVEEMFKVPAKKAA